jgi:2-oxoglutarate dehydrogenase complex dehydrogenase (E1) component-like enzyme
VTCRNTNSVQHLIFCTGKIFYELWTERKKRNLETNVALIRIEVHTFCFLCFHSIVECLFFMTKLQSNLQELVPFPWGELRSVLDSYHMNNIQTMTWCQEEPENMGAWHYVDSRFRNLLGIQV